MSQYDNHYPTALTGQELYLKMKEAGVIGMWKDREDIGDSSEYARLLRESSSKRY